MSPERLKGTAIVACGVCNFLGLALVEVYSIRQAAELEVVVEYQLEVLNASTSLSHPEVIAVTGAGDNFS